MTRPPAMSSVAPVSQLALAEARNSVAAATLLRQPGGAALSLDAVASAAGATRPICCFP